MSFLSNLFQYQFTRPDCGTYLHSFVLLLYLHLGLSSRTVSSAINRLRFFAFLIAMMDEDFCFCLTFRFNLFCTVRVRQSFFRFLFKTRYFQDWSRRFLFIVRKHFTILIIDYLLFFFVNFVVELIFSRPNSRWLQSEHHIRQRIKSSSGSSTSRWTRRISILTTNSFDLTLIRRWFEGDFDQNDTNPVIALSKPNCLRFRNICFPLLAYISLNYQTHQNFSLTYLLKMTLFITMFVHIF